MSIILKSEETPLHILAKNKKAYTPALSHFQQNPQFALVNSGKINPLPVHIACESGNPIAIDMLKTYPHLKNKANKLGKKPIDIAKKNKHSFIVKYIKKMNQP